MCSKELTVVGRLDEEEILLEVGAAQQLAGAHDELVALLQRPAADETAEAGQMEGQRSGAHHQLVRIQPLGAPSAFRSVHPSQTTATIHFISFHVHN